MSKYQIIYADPPWHYNSRSNQDNDRGYSDLKPYTTLKQNELENLPIKNITNDDAACFMWVTDSHLKEGIKLIEAWGFKYKTIAFIWIKHYKSGVRCVNFAPWTLKSAEICILGIKGRMKQCKITNKIYQVVDALRTTHSRKPAEVRKRIDEMFGDLPRIELFAREKTEGWTSIGDGIDGMDIKESLDKLITQ